MLQLWHSICINIEQINNLSTKHNGRDWPTVK